MGLLVVSCPREHADPQLVFMQLKDMDRGTKASSNPVTTQQTKGQFIMRNGNGPLEIKRIVTVSDEDDASFGMVEVIPPSGGGFGISSLPGRRKRSEQGKYGGGIMWQFEEKT